MFRFPSITLEITTLTVGNRRVHFTLNGGESVCLRGANGTGKTALLSCLAGVPRHPQHAHMRLRHNGRDILGHDSGFQTLLHWQSHQPALLEGASVREEWQFWRQIFDPRPENFPSDVTLAEKVGLGEHLLDQDVTALSAGEKQKAALARLFLSPRPIWLLDEPESHLDETACTKLHSWIDAHCAEGGIVLYSSHMTNSTATREWRLGVE